MNWRNCRLSTKTPYYQLVWAECFGCKQAAKCPKLQFSFHLMKKLSKPLHNINGIINDLSTVSLLRSSLSQENKEKMEGRSFLKIRKKWNEHHI